MIEQEEQVLEEESGSFDFNDVLRDAISETDRALEEEQMEEEKEEVEDEEDSEEKEDVEEEGGEEEEEKEEKEPAPITDLSAYEVPKEFKSKDEALKWYAEKYEDLKEAVAAPEEYKTKVLERYEEEVEGFKNAYVAMQKNPKEFFMQYLPEVLMENGISPVMTEEEINQELEKAIKFEFGADYKSQYKPEDLINPRSYSTRLLNKMHQLRAEFEAKNKENQELYKQWNEKIAKGESNIPQRSVTPEQARRAAEEQYVRFKDYGFSEEQFKEFLDAAEAHKLELEDFHKVIYFDGYMEEAYRKGAEDSQRKVSGTFRPAARKRMPDSVSRLLDSQQKAQPKNETRTDPADFFKGLEFKIPNY